ncbi:cytochrome c [Flavobacterium sp. ANB]|uniref:c-type cytochrome n=1 Tax=unclassified Flavobacterium TaxID=196869 RepID=UPI0012B8AD84|nr:MULTISPECIES: cytochrome c [unclassified Flavobacterium]MBF4518899.1 cytochrome c [Flavobacterium sp. ANB]MTD71388.1 cytochrome c [Flavobacterium sp. LC2016-13]
MKKYIYLSGIILSLYGCESNTYESLEEPEVIVGTVTYNANTKAVFDANCIACHPSGGTLTPLETYAEVKDAMQNTNLLDRIQRQNGTPGQMPKAGRMSQDKINTILQWNTDGLLEN